MTYLNIKEAIEYTSKSNSTIRNHLRSLKTRGIKQYKGKDILTYKKLKNRSSQVFILKDYLDSVYNINMSINKSINTQFDMQITRDSDSLIDALKDHIQTLKEELRNKNKQINEFLILEQKAIDRIQEQNHIIHQLNIIIDDRKTLNTDTIKEPIIEEVESIEEEESCEAKEDLTEQTENLSQKRKEILNKEMNKNQSQNIYSWLHANTYARKNEI